MMSLVPTFAESVQVDTALVTAATLGIMWGMFQGIAWLIKKYTGNPQNLPAMTPPHIEQQPVHWTDITGEMRPVNSQECAARHAALTEELKKGSSRMERLTDSVNEVSTQLVRVGEQIGAGVDLRIRTVADQSADSAIAKHESGPYHRNNKAAS